MKIIKNFNKMSESQLSEMYELLENHFELSTSCPENKMKNTLVKFREKNYNQSLTELEHEIIALDFSEYNPEGIKNPLKTDAFYFPSIGQINDQEFTSSRPNKDDLTPERLEYWG